MRNFVVRARSASTDSKMFLSGVGGSTHSEILAHTMMNAIFIAQSHRDDTVLYLVLESSPDFSRTLRFTPSEMRDIGGFNEAILLQKIALALDASKGMAKNEMREVQAGVQVRTIGFEKLTQELSQSCELYVLEKKGTDIRSVTFGSNPCFLLTDHIPMPKNALASLKRLGAHRISLGPKMLFASQCVVLLHNALDLAECSGIEI